MRRKPKKPDVEPLPPIDVDKALHLAGEIRKSMYAWRKRKAPPPPAGDTVADDASFVGGGPMSEEAMREFDYVTVAKAFESLAKELDEELERANQEMMQTAIRIYWEAVKLSKDPANANLIPQVEKMREAYKKDFGTEVPPLEEVEEKK
jgi:hypothetical protein